jgi:hypothetical protein
VDPGADLDPQRAHIVGECGRAADRSVRLCERREESVAGVILLSPTEPLQRSSHDPVEPRGEFPIPRVAELRGDIGRAHDVEHQHGRDPALGHSRSIRFVGGALKERHTMSGWMSIFA